MPELREDLSVDTFVTQEVELLGQRLRVGRCVWGGEVGWGGRCILCGRVSCDVCRRWRSRGSGSGALCALALTVGVVR